MLLGCGSSPTGTVPPPPSPPTTPTIIRLSGDPGDYVGGGVSYTYTKATAAISVTATGRRLRVVIGGDETWTGEFLIPGSVDRLQTGTFNGLSRDEVPDRASGALTWFGEGRGCNTSSGSLTITNVTYAGTTLTSIDLTFEQHCEGAPPALRGSIDWRAADPAAPPPPVNPPPAGLWAPPPGSVPATGNFLYLASEPGDFVGNGKTWSYTQVTGVFTTAGTSRQFDLVIEGDERWTVSMVTMSTIDRFDLGYYPALRRTPGHNPAKGGLNVDGDQRGCSRVEGWFVVDEVTYTNGVLTGIAARFEQRCDSQPAVLHGALRWRSDDPTKPTGPVTPIATTLWKPSAPTPTSGNYVILESEPGDYIGQGQNRLYTDTDAAIMVGTTDGRIAVSVGGWSGHFLAMNALDSIAVGYYPDLRRYPFGNPTKGSLDWSGMGRGCNRLRGWFIVDRVVYSGDVMTGLDLRFEQQCEQTGPVLHGAVHWNK